MNFRRKVLISALALSTPLISGSLARAAAPDYTAATAGPDVAMELDMAKTRLEKAKIRLDISKKQVDAAKARLKAAQAEHKAARANYEAKSLEKKARKLSDASGLPVISDTMIEASEKRQLASSIKPAKTEEKSNTTIIAPAPAITPGAAPASTPIDLSNTRIKQVDFNSQTFEKSSAPVAGAQEQPPIVP